MISLRCCSVLLPLLAFLGVATAQTPTKEYIYLGGRVIAIENPPPPPAPVISSLSPNSGVVGTAVTITGSNFGASGTVTFNGTAASVSSWGATSISTTVPSGASTGNVVVTANGLSSNGMTFTVPAAETVTTPNTPFGPTSAVKNLTYTYTTGGSVSSYGNPVQYRFYWGDGSDSGWLASGTTSASHSWSTAGTRSVTVQARSAPTGVLSSTSAARSVSVVSGYANFSISSSTFYTYDGWTLSLSTNIPNAWFTLCALVPGQGQSCTPNWDKTDANGNLTPQRTGYFPPGNAGSWREWIEFPGLDVRSNDIYFTVSDYANFSIDKSNIRLSEMWTIWLETSIPNTSFTICAIFPSGSQSCTPNWAQTNSSGYWTDDGYFSAGDIGPWQEWIVFPTATSNTIYFTVSP